ncbi:hypothetical protein MSAN_02210300 [Mycena sanguinolenta]|uniref:Uncharacterized protein n=1 Tax=Mycena sanguinolenta TaxID=230812 RepID=A0A8H6XE12_9AGAR|nr:hypothetical protein MSAN_02210300 [Mycena sanguinolenta]
MRPTTAPLGAQDDGPGHMLTTASDETRRTNFISSARGSSSAQDAAAADGAAVHASCQCGRTRARRCGSSGNLDSSHSGSRNCARKHALAKTSTSTASGNESRTAAWTGTPADGIGD